jgi:hypothetical protein
MDWVRETLLIERNIHVFLAGVEPRSSGFIFFLSCIVDSKPPQHK